MSLGLRPGAAKRRDGYAQGPLCGKSLARWQPWELARLLFTASARAQYFPKGCTDPPQVVSMTAAKIMQNIFASIRNPQDKSVSQISEGTPVLHTL